MSIVRFIGYWIALDAFLLGFWCLCVIAATARNARHNCECDLAEAERVIESPFHDRSI